MFDLIRSGATVNVTLGGSDNAQNGRMTDIEAPSDTSQASWSTCSLRTTGSGGVLTNFRLDPTRTSASVIVGRSQLSRTRDSGAFAAGDLN
jgi:hypothetical protein